MSLNKAILMGRITASPELKTTTSGISVTNFTIAADRRYQAKGEEKKTDFIDCTAWRNTAEFVSKYFAKGDMIAVVGEIQTDTYTDKDGNKRKKVIVSVESASFCGSKAESGQSGTAPNDTAPPAMEFEELDSDDELPF